MPDTTSIVIFGASGDLTKRKLIPALFSLYRKGRLPEAFHIVGMARSEYDDDSYRQLLRDGMQEFAPGALEADAWKAFAENIGYERGSFAESESMQSLNETLSRVENENGGRANRLYYLATPPSVYAGVIEGLGESRVVAQDSGWRRVIIEKPFGHDLESAHQLNEIAHHVLEEDQIYRIDHYLGKETVQNVLVFRFANSIFEPIWNHQFIDHVQITVAESVGVGHRGDFYDKVGVLRDMFQNHLMQLLSLVAMEPPASFDATAIRNERVKVLSSIRPIPKENLRRHTVRAQYRAYRDEPGVDKASTTETYAALKLYIDNWRWKDVPFYIRSGKNLTAKSSEVLIQFRSVPHLMFPLEPGEEIRRNLLALCIQPDEGMHLRFEAKVPDTSAMMRSVNMEFNYADAFGAGAIPEAYERLLLDAISGDPSLFTRADTIELSWALIDSILDGWKGEHAPPLAFYEAGTWGPTEADDFMAADGREWIMSCGSE